MANLAIIRQAMASAPPKIIGFTYNKSTTGETEKYVTEPYEIDEAEGLFWGYKLNGEKPGIRKFFLNNMANEALTNQTFNPRWPLYPFGK